MHTSARLVLLLFALFAGMATKAQSPLNSVPTALVVKGKWVKSNYFYDSGSGNYFFDDGKTKTEFDTYFKNSPDYMRGQPWARNETVAFGKKTYERYGLPRVLGYDDIKPAGKIGTVLVMVAADEKAKVPEQIWLPYEASMGVVSLQPFRLKK